MATLTFKNLNKIYNNDVQAVFDFSLDIKDKEFIVFVGPSGCGKSTTLRMVAGLEDITTGELYIDNVLVNSVEPKDRNIAMVFQNYALYPHMTVYDNMAFALKLRKIPCPVYNESEEAKKLIEENALLVKEANALRRKAKKQKEDKDMLEEASKKYDQVIANDKTIKEMLEKDHAIGIWEEKIKELEGRKKVINTEIKKFQKCLAKGGYEPDIVKALEDAVSQREKQLEELEKEIEHYKTTEVPLFASRKLTRYEMDIEVNRAAKILDLERYLLRKPAALSGGQRQRVALGRAIVRNPKVFLMDEPLSNLDAKLRVQTRSEIINIHKRVNATTIYVTHDQTEAMTMADRIVVMKDGYIQQIDTPYDIYYNPNNIFVASFIGNPPMNFLNGKFDGKCVVLDSKDEKEHVSFKLNEEQIKTLQDFKDKEIVIGIRPENMFQKGNQEIKDAKNFLDITCEFRELMGYDSIVHTHISGQPLQVKVSSVKKIKEGDALNIGFNNDALYFFNKEDSKRIR